MEDRRHRISRWVDLFGPRAFGFALTITESEDEARDLVQETWLVLLDHQGPLPKTDGAARRWIFNILHKIAVTRTRTRERRVGLLEYFHLDVPGATEAPAAGLDDRALMREILRCIDELPALQRRVLVARLMEGRSVRETAEELGRAPGTIKTSLARAIRSLRDALGSDLEAALQRAPLWRTPPDSPDPPEE